MSCCWCHSEANYHEAYDEEKLFCDAFCQENYYGCGLNISSSAFINRGYDIRVIPIKIKGRLGKVNLSDVNVNGRQISGQNRIVYNDELSDGSKVLVKYKIPGGQPLLEKLTIQFKPPGGIKQEVFNVNVNLGVIPPETLYSMKRRGRAIYIKLTKNRNVCKSCAGIVFRVYYGDKKYKIDAIYLNYSGDVIKPLIEKSS